MKNLLIIAIVAIGMLTSCKEKANAETENTEVQAAETTEQSQVISDSVAKAEQAKVDAAHGHSH